MDPLAEYLERNKYVGDAQLALSASGAVRATGTVHESRRAFMLPTPTRQRIERWLAEIPWDELPGQELGDVNSPIVGELRAGGRAVRVGSGADEPPALAKALNELRWVLQAARDGLLLRAARFPAYPNDPNSMELRIGAGGSVELRTPKGPATGQLDDAELGRLQGLLEGMRFAELDLRADSGRDWVIEHGMNTVLLDTDTMPAELAPLLRFCDEIAVDHARALPPHSPGA